MKVISQMTPWPIMQAIKSQKGEGILKNNMNTYEKEKKIEGGKVWKRNEKRSRKQGLQAAGKVSRFLYKICKKPENYEALKGIVTQRKGYRRLERENYVALEGNQNDN